MRLIDADLLIAEGKKRKITAVIPEYKELPYDTQEVLGRLGSTMKKIILDAPTVDAVPVVPGRWIPWHTRMNPNGEYRIGHNKYLGVFCSNCDKHSDNMTDFCPNCGAKMD